MSKQAKQASQSMPRHCDTSTGKLQGNMEMGMSLFSPFLAANISMLNWNANCCRRIAGAYSQWFDFLGHRLEQDASFAQQLQTAKDPEKLSKACAKFIETAAKDYQAEFSELSKLANDATDLLQDISVGQENGAAVMGE